MEMAYGDVLDEETERIATVIVDSVFRVHWTLGPGLLESVYVKCLVLELESRSLKVRREVPVPAVYMGRKIEPGLRLDLLVDDHVVVEAKAVEAPHPIYFPQPKPTSNYPTGGSASCSVLT
jgi:GxxExxY protein